MTGGTLGATTAGSEEIAQLRDRVRALEIRLERLEQGAVLPASPPAQETALTAPAPGVVMDAEVAAATLFKRIALLCFVLLGALILRVLTQQNILGPRLGTALGFIYSGHLIVLSLVPGRVGRFVRENSVFECSGAVLAFLIAGESALGTLTMSRVSAMIAIAGFGLVALGMGIHQRKAVLAGTGVIGAIVTLVALDLKTSGIALQLTLVVLLAAAGIASSWRAGMGWLRPITISLVLMLMPAGFFFCGKEPGAAVGLLAASAAIGCVMVLQHLAAFRQLRHGAAWLPLATLWFAGIQQLAGWPFAAATNAAIAIVALIAVSVYARYVTGAAGGFAGLMATSTFAGAIGWTMLDQTGLLCAVGGIALWFTGRRAASDWAAGLATLLMLVATGAGLAQLLWPPVAVPVAAAIGISALILLFHYARNGHAGTQPYAGLDMRLAPVALACGLVLLLGVFRELLNHLFHEPAPLLLSQTLLLVIIALALTFWGHAAHRRAVLFCGLTCMAVALAKVLLIDLMSLRSLYMLASLVFVALASVAVYAILRRASGAARAFEST